MSEKALRVQVKLINNILWKRVYGEYRTLSDFCRRYSVGKAVVGNLLKLKRNPFKQDGSYCADCKRIARKLEMDPADLFPRLLYCFDQSVMTIELDLDEFPAIKGR